jgi:putative transcriptional regulator
MNSIGPGPTGVIINRPTRLGVSHLFPDLERLAHLNDKLYFGGPVDIASVSFVIRSGAPPANSIQVLDGVYFSTNRELLHRLVGRDKPMDGLRIFVGHSSWAPSQLEAEIARGDWTLAPPETDAIFDGKSKHPWPEQQGPDAVPRT